MRPSRWLRTRAACVDAARLVLVAVALAAWSAPSAAQVVPERLPGSFHVGPLSVTPAIVIKHIGVDTNVFNTAEDRKSDFTFTMGPEVEANVDLRRVRVSFSGAADFVYFQQYEGERSINRHVGGNVEFDLARFLTLSGGHAITNARERLSFEVPARVRRLVSSQNAGVALHLGRRMELGISGATAATEFAEDAVFEGVALRQTLNQDARSLSAAVRYTLTPLTTVSLQGTATEERFPLFPQRDTDSTQFILGGRFEPRALISGEARVGYQFSKRLNDDAPDFGGIVAGVELLYQPGDSTELGVTAGRSTGYSFDATVPYYVVNTYGGSVRRHLFRRVDVFLIVERHTFHYQGVTGRIGTAGLEGPDSVSRFMMDLGTRVTKHARAGLYVDYVQPGKGAGRIATYDGLRIGATLSYGVFKAGNLADGGGFARPR